MSNSTDQPKYSFEEFQLYYESTEKVTDRRQNGNKLNYSICVAVLLAIAYIWNWSIDHPKYAYSGFTLIVVLSLLAVLFSWFWIGQIKDFKKLNAAKFHVLNDIIAPHIVFDYKGTKYNVVSSNPFQKEWDMLKSTGALQARPRYNIRALESSNIEYFVPQAFIAVFCLFFLTAILPIVLHLNFFLVAWKNLMRL